VRQAFAPNDLQKNGIEPIQRVQAGLQKNVHPILVAVLIKGGYILDRLVRFVHLVLEHTKRLNERNPTEYSFQPIVYTVCGLTTIVVKGTSRRGAWQS